VVFDSKRFFKLCSSDMIGYGWLDGLIDGWMVGWLSEYENF
jgi:hypothetical protein